MCDQCVCDQCVCVCPQGLLYFDTRLKMLEKRQQQLRDLRSKHERLKVELQEAKSHLMVAPHRWSGDCESGGGVR